MKDGKLNRFGDKLADKIASDNAQAADAKARRSAGAKAAAATRKARKDAKAAADRAAEAKTTREIAQAEEAARTRPTVAEMETMPMADLRKLAIDDYVVSGRAAEDAASGLRTMIAGLPIEEPELDPEEGDKPDTCHEGTSDGIIGECEQAELDIPPTGKTPTELVINHTHYALLKQNSIVRYEGRLWMVGMVNVCRARLDPLTGFTATMSASGRSFTTYGASVNVSATSVLDIIDPADVDEKVSGRIERLKAQNAAASNGTHEAGHNGNNAAGGDDMADETKVAGQPTPKMDKAKAAKLAKKPVKATKPLGPKPAKVKAEKKPKEQKPCLCGCGEKTGSFFKMGHDARFKGLMLKVERGEKTPDEVFTKAVVAAYKWVKNGDGLRTTTNYKGEAHKGYDAK
jgi:hypothetical protein